MKLRRKIPSVLLFLVFMISMLSIAAFGANKEDQASVTSQFTDMPKNWSTTALENAVENGLLNGSGGKIRPNSNLTRAQMTAIIARAFGATVKGDISSFTDVTPSAWYADNVAIAYKMGVIKGSNGKMNPNEAITRQEAFVIIARALKLNPAGTINTTFSDVGEISNWAKGDVFSLVNGGYIIGSNDNLNPGDPITLAEFSQLFYNIFKQYISTSGSFTSVSSGNIMINKPGVNLKDVNVTGDLIVGDGVGDGDVILDNVKITGRLVIRGGGENSIIIKGGTSVKNVVVARVDGAVSVKVQGNADVDAIYIQDGLDDVNIQGIVGNVEVAAPNITVMAVAASINNVSVSGTNSKVVVGIGSAVQTIAVNSEASNVAVQVDGKVTNVSTNAPNTQVKGTGTVTKVEAKEGSRGSSIVTPNTRIVVSSGVPGVTAGGGQSINTGSTATNNTKGTGIISTSGSSSSGGNSSPSKTQLTISAPMLATSKAYDSTTTAIVTAGSLSGVMGSDTVTVSAVAIYDTKNVGTGKTITVSYTLGGSDVAKYTAPANYTTNTGEITATTQLTIAAPTLTKSKAYDGNTTAAVTAGTLNGVIPGDTVTVSAAGSYADKTVGTGKTITVAYMLGGTDAGNYLAPVNGTDNTGAITATQLTIVAPTLTTSKAYDGNTTAAVTAGALNGVILGDIVTVSAAGSYADKTVGTGKTITVVYSLGGADASKYTAPANYTDNTGEITAIQLTISSPTLTTSKAYDGNTTAAVTAGTLNGILPGDIVTVSAAASYADKNGGIGKIITVVYTLGGADAGKYLAPIAGTNTNGVITPPIYGYCYDLATIADRTIVGGADIPFSNNGSSSGVDHTEGNTTFMVPEAGNYLINYNVSITAGVGSQLALAVNGTVNNSTAITALVPSGEMSGTAMLSLAAGDVITLRNNSAIPLTMELAPSVGAQMSIVKVYATYGYGYKLTTNPDVAVAGLADVPFSNNGPLNGVSHTPGTTTFTVLEAGNYLINYDVSITNGVGSGLALAVNGTADASTQIAALVAPGEMSGTAMLSLAAGDIITLRNSSGISLTMVGAQMSIMKVDANYGYGYNLATVAAATVAGGSQIWVSNNGSLNGVSHTAGAADFIVTEAGDYLINYNVSITAGVGSQLALAVNGIVNNNSTQITALATGEMSGTAVLSLAAGDYIALRNNSAVAFTMAIAPSVGAQINIIKLK